ncbi:MAG: hypothetical protein ACRDHP_18250 [Ktedonobacterales bacterium]
MSTEGAGSLVLVPAGLVLLPAAVLLGAAVGSGYLIAQGAMYCGKKLDENYKSRCQTWTDEQLDNYRKDRANRADPRALLAASLRQMESSRANLGPTVAADPAARQRTEAGIANALALAHAALADTPQSNALLTSQAVHDLQVRLRAELEGSDALPPANQTLVARARSLAASSDAEASALKQTLTDLRLAWTDAHEADLLRAHHRSVASSTLQQVEAQLQALRLLPQQSGIAVDTVLLQRLTDAENDTSIAASRMDTNPALALSDATRIAATVDEVAASMTATVINSWDNRFVALATLRGKVIGLRKMVGDARDVQIASERQLAQLEEALRICEREIEAQASGQAADVANAPTAKAHLAALTRRVDDLKRDVFALVSQRQQQSLTGVIADTLREAGFTRESGLTETPEIAPQADGSLVVTGVRNYATDDLHSDEKLVIFSVAPDGSIRYDFSGYQGSACLDAAHEIFTRLRDKGIVLLDPAQLGHMDLAAATPEQLRGMPLPTLDVNKRQTELVERFRQAFARLGYRDVQETVYGGTIQLDGRNGRFGYYHVELDATGNADVSRDERDVSGNASDDLILESRAAVLPPRHESSRSSDDTNSTMSRTPLGPIGQ